MEKPAMESKKFSSMLVGIGSSLIAGAALVAFGGPAIIPVIAPYVFGAITAISGVHIGGQAVVDYKNENAKAQGKKE